MTRTILASACLAVLVGCDAVLDQSDMECVETRAFARPWHELSNSELRIEIARACGRVFVGFKEEGAARGVDPQGRSLTSPETFARMKAYLTDRAISIEWAGIDLPHVTARMPAQVELVAELRSHPNVDYVEPIFPGTRWGQ